MDFWNSLADVERAAEVAPYIVVVFGVLVSVSGIFLKGRIDKRAGRWNGSSVLERAARVTPYAVVLVGALVSASGIHVSKAFVVKHVSSPPIDALTDCFCSISGGQFSALNNNDRRRVRVRLVLGSPQPQNRRSGSHPVPRYGRASLRWDRGAG